MLYELLLAPLFVHVLYIVKDWLRILLRMLIDYTPVFEYREELNGINEEYRLVFKLIKGLAPTNKEVIWFDGGFLKRADNPHVRKATCTFSRRGALDRYATLNWFYGDPANEKKWISYDYRLARIETLCERGGTKNMVPTRAQQNGMEIIAKTFREKGSCVAILSGPPGTGKSAFHMFLTNAQRAVGMKIRRLDEHNLLSVQSVPIVYLVEEFDAQLFTVMKSLDPDFRFKVDLAEMKTKDTTFPTKQGWNELLDRINSGRYGRVIVLLTTNVEMVNGTFGNCDASLLRAGRVDHKLVFDEPISVK